MGGPTLVALQIMGGPTQKKNKKILVKVASVEGG